MRAVAGRHRGSVLMLMPAAMVIMLLLGAIAVDSAIVYLEQRQAYNVAFDAANDAAGAALSGTAVRAAADDEPDGGVEIEIDPGHASRVAATTVAASGNEHLQLQSVEVRDDGAVAVTVRVEVRRLFGQAFGADRRSTLTITAVAGGETRAPE